MKLVDFIKEAVESINEDARAKPIVVDTEFRCCTDMTKTHIAVIAELRSLSGVIEKAINKLQWQYQIDPTELPESFEKCVDALTDVGIIYNPYGSVLYWKNKILIDK